MKKTKTTEVRPTHPSTLHRTCLIALAVTLAWAHIGFADEIVTGPVDKTTFQAIVDAAQPHDTIVCRPGLYDFSRSGPILLTKPVTLTAADPTDPPIFLGHLTGSGSPATGGNPLEGKTAFAVPGGTQVNGIKLEGLSLTGFNRAVVIYDGFDDRQAGCPAVGERLSNFEFTGNKSKTRFAVCRF